MNRPHVLPLALLCAGLCLAQPAPASSLSTIQLRGVAALLPTLRPAAERYMAQYPGSSVVVSAGSSSFGLKALLDGSADVALVEGAPPPALLRAIARQELRLRQRVVAYRALLPVVHADNPLLDVSLPALRAILAGELRQWHELGAGDGEIVVLADAAAVRSWQAGMATPWGRYGRQTWLLPAVQLSQLLATTPHAIALLAGDALPASAKVLPVDGVSATAANLASGRYPLRLPLSLWWRADAPPAVLQFLTWWRPLLPAAAGNTRS